VPLDVSGTASDRSGRSCAYCENRSFIVFDLSRISGSVTTATLHLGVSISFGGPTETALVVD
jgi:hypothetical protein